MYQVFDSQGLDSPDRRDSSFPEDEIDLEALEAKMKQIVAERGGDTPVQIRASELLEIVSTANFLETDRLFWQDNAWKILELAKANQEYAQEALALIR